MKDREGALSEDISERLGASKRKILGRIYGVLYIYI